MYLTFSSRKTRIDKNHEGETNMVSNEFIDRFGKYNAAYGRYDADQRAMSLRNALLLPKGGRGKYAPHLEPVHMGRLLIGLTASNTAKEAAKTVIEYANMSAIGEQLFEGADDLETALTEIFKGEFEDGKFKLDVKEIVICRSWPEVVIILMDGRCFTFRTLEPPTHEKQFCRIDYRVGWGFFHDVLCHVESEKDMRELEKVIKSDEDVEAYRQYKLKIIKIGNEQGEEAARKWAKENPFKSENS